jgi:hypothetical protein
MPSGATDMVVVKRGLAALERLETLELVCDVSRDVSSSTILYDVVSCVLQLVTRHLRVFRYATGRGASAPDWSDSLVPILDRGVRRSEPIFPSPSSSSSSSSSSASPSPGTSPSSSTASLQPPPPAPGLRVLDLRFCHEVGSRLQEVLFAGATPKLQPSSTDSMRRALRDLAIGPSASHATLPPRSFDGTAVDGPQEDASDTHKNEVDVAGLDALVVLRLEANAAYSDREWLAFVALPALRYVTVCNAPPEKWARVWRERGVAVSIVTAATVAA